MLTSQDGEGIAGPSSTRPESSQAALLRHQPPYWFTFTANAKQRWYGRRILDILTEEFRDRTKHYYTWAIHKGLLKINGKDVSPTQIVCNGDVITHTAHKHEPPITSDPVRVIYRNDAEGRIVIVKPGSIPVHPAGRYLRHTLLELMKSDHGVDKLYTANRIDRLTSGIMVASTNVTAAKALSGDFDAGRVRKAYVCRVKGKFSEQETTCTAPLISLDRQTGVVISHGAGREAKTIFNRLSYDTATDTSIVFCRPVTGRTHQIRVHAQLLGHPIPNDPIYNHQIWAHYPPTSLANISIPDLVSQRPEGVSMHDQEPDSERAIAQTYLDIVKYLASTPQCATIIESLKNAKDEGEDFSRLKDEVRFAAWNKEAGWLEGDTVEGLVNAEPARGSAAATSDDDNGQHSLGYCSECFLPLLPDPEPNSLLIYLHAIRYETDEWSFEDEMPWWAMDDWASPGALQRAKERRAAGQAVRPPRLGLVNEEERKPLAPSAANVEKPAAPAKQEKAGKKKSEQIGISLSAPLPRAGDWPCLLAHPWAPANTVSQKSSALAAGPQIQIVLEVFRGLEDFARLDLLSRLRASLPPSCPEPAIQTAIQSSHLILSPSLTRFALETPLPFTAGKHILLSQRALPDELLDQLMEDRVKLGTYKLRNRAMRAKKRGQGAKPASQEAIAVAEEQQQEQACSALPDEVEKMADGSLASEARLKELISEMWATSSENFKSAVNLWRAQRSRARRSDRWTWRVSVERSAYKLPSLVTIDLEGHLADQIWYTVNDDVDPPGSADDKQKYDESNVPHPVSLKKADLVVELVFAPFLGAAPTAADEARFAPARKEQKEQQANQQGSNAPANVETQKSQRRRPPRGQQNLAQAWESNPSGSLMLMIKLEHFEDEDEDTGEAESVDIVASSLAMAHRPRVSNDLTEGGTAMARFRAYSLASLLPLPTAHTGDKGPLRIWEPCVGTGTVAIELAELLRQRQLEATVYASDVGELEVKRAREIGAMSGWPDEVKRGGVKVEYGLLDLRAVAKGTHGKGLQPEEEVPNTAQPPSWPAPSSLDGIITDLPWGRRVLGHGSLNGLYLHFVQSACLSLKPHCYVVVLTLEGKTLQRAVREAEGLARKRGEGWAMRFEELAIARGEAEAVLAVEEQGRRQARELEEMRVVEMGLRPVVCLLRKIAVE
ncbi:hypothetical protein BDZ90DRAFT_237877 [Jaminaea rosea]|uniref:Pseudouridine synthase n=1 Tax=Jaminaea rosea TaxID=1569628 RepID=A0A316UUH0_9BASI|nr:hypothetical protein BDZ90DRAFT_237877 [Jaminaea rosea]PWN28929.1 hypothetical protein BDZ90DRAFT_237877 [Jaminaea rosea]